MNKTDLLFHMMEQPHAYTEAQWQEVLSDPECHELYTLMAKTKSAYDVQHEVSDDEVDAEWRRLNQRRNHRWLRIAAMFVGVVLISGLALAAIIRLSPSLSTKDESNNHAQTFQRPTEQVTPKATEPAAASDTVVFDNVPLDSIVGRIAAYHHVGADVQNPQAAELRFYFVWLQAESLPEVVEQLNQFERINIVMDHGKLTVQ